MSFERWVPEAADGKRAYHLVINQTDGDGYDLDGLYLCRASSTRGDILERGCYHRGPLPRYG